MNIPDFRDRIMESSGFNFPSDFTQKDITYWNTFEERERGREKVKKINTDPVVMIAKGKPVEAVVAQFLKIEDPNIRLNLMNEGLVVAAEFSQVDTIQKLLEAGLASKDAIRRHDMCSPVIAATKSQAFNVLEVLAKFGANFVLVDEDGYSC